MTAVKVCGAVSADDVATVAAGGADLVGLWHGVDGGHAELPMDRLVTLAGTAAALGLQAVLVTLLRDARRLGDLIRTSAVPMVQLHGYQPPGVVRAVKAHAEVTVVKVLHVGPEGCPELGLIDAYLRAGTDLFLIDAATGDGRLGSTGRRVAADQVLALADRCGAPFLLAGGIDARLGTHEPVAGHPLFHGVDVDTGARDTAGRLDRGRITDIVRTWRAAPTVVPR
ncbi:phosphoribosylanthranilate isomerase [Couchioplanes azureus]|uniref:phosphoribosylanthranilate isomerase n=1 Tax=Couchioplanes caeruleus TaxID=56438 RepID=UPI001671180E|nr:N-(5'-phosphoribosyl)anthranilate isomerase [Couchioplanes caeruleus]GGQ86193.1 hypothetical protein GCM10010166_65490 [Couchioplanes caeruleus subsp. azureus]